MRRLLTLGVGQGLSPLPNPSPARGEGLQGNPSPARGEGLQGHPSSARGEGHPGLRLDNMPLSGEPVTAMQMPPTGQLVSVALCTYNGERYLREQLDSILAQRDVRLEVVAVDDASQDGTLALLRDYAARDGRVRVESNPHNLGPLRSFERAIALCTGEFIAPSDQDDIWDADKLSVLLAAIGDADLAYCDSEYIDGDGRRSGRRISGDRAMMHGRKPLQFVFANSVSGHACVLRRSLFEAALPFPDGVFHDWWLALCAAAGRGVAYVDRTLVQYRRHGEAFSPVGRDAGPVPGGNRAWLIERRRLLEVFVAHRLRDHERAAVLLAVLQQAMSGGSRVPLLRWIWSEREAAPPGTRSRALNALRLQARVLNKLRRARGEPEATEPRFRL